MFASLGSRIRRRERLREMADEDLMQLVRGGRADAFEVVYDRHADAAFSLAYRICGRRAVAEEVTQEGFIAVWRSGARYEPGRGSVRNWILGIVHFRALDQLRRHAVHERGRTLQPGAAERVAALERTDQEVVSRERSREVRAALAQLPQEQSRVLELAYFGGLTQGEIAAVLEIPLGTVKGRMRLGLGKLRLSLDDVAEVI